MKTRIKLDLYVLKSILLQLCVKKKDGEGLSKSSEMVIKIAHQNPKLIPGMTTYSNKDCLASLAQRTDKCIVSACGMLFHS